MHTNKASGKNPTVQECSKFALDELRHIPITPALAG
jgi:hypothetical protein